jgi:hypothetical protein
MVALVEQGRVASAYVGDINTQEIYGYRPGSRSVHRISEYETSERLAHIVKPVAEQYALLRDPPHAYSHASRALLESFKFLRGRGRQHWNLVGTAMEAGGRCRAAVTHCRDPMGHGADCRDCQDARLSFLSAGRRGLEGVRTVVGEDISQRDHDLLVIHERDASALQVGLGP